MYEYVSDRVYRSEAVPKNYILEAPTTPDETHRLFVSLPTGSDVDLSKVTTMLFGDEDIETSDDPEENEQDVLEIWAEELDMEVRDMPSHDLPVGEVTDITIYARNRQ